ncbi:TetR/AcrR family transcriptional regulator [Caldisalinibacter kiritimatiensis]|uniref:Transcriptional regulator, TetR family n=1 Tax=Caldisalinibacter kiritimatiensis TaxID=1304284 RepID=R1CND3_9FIRM|nr:TetR/AcrR family transcriptional regulator [Caldisalinibacter kiritimatiensis]EOD00221.1 transcriptional regulator, TetR family [Caldisalinibacter kiritimatiensis]
MPKDTFFNLPEEKRERIIEAAIDEFAKHTYHKASINRIVEKSDIAKGSFYQYFEDKKDLFKYIIKLSSEKKLQYLMHVIGNMEDMNFFQIVRELYIAGLKFAKDNPKLATIGQNFMKDTDTKLKEEILGENMPKSDNFFEQILRREIEKGEIVKDLDVKVIAHMITSLSISIGEYFYLENGIADDDKIMSLVDTMIYVLENGIKK